MLNNAACVFVEVVANPGPRHGRTNCVLLFTKKTGYQVQLLQFCGLQEFLAKRTPNLADFHLESTSLPLRWG